VCSKPTSGNDLQRLDDLGSLSVTGRVFNVYYTGAGWFRSSIVSSGGNLNGQIASFAQEGVDSFVADVLSARRSSSTKQLVEAWHDEPPMTLKQWDEFLKANTPSN
jgi:hypothetical protein